MRGQQRLVVQQCFDGAIGDDPAVIQYHSPLAEFVRGREVVGGDDLGDRQASQNIHKVTVGFRVQVGEGFVQHEQ